MNVKILILQEGGNISEKVVNITSAMMKKGLSKVFTGPFCKKYIDNLGSGKITQGKGSHGYLRSGVCSFGQCLRTQMAGEIQVLAEPGR